MRSSINEVTQFLIIFEKPSELSRFLVLRLKSLVVTAELSLIGAWDGGFGVRSLRFIMNVREILPRINLENTRVVKCQKRSCPFKTHNKMANKRSFSLILHVDKISILIN